MSSDFDFSSMFDTIKSGVSSLAEDSLKDYASKAASDIEDFLGSIQGNIEKWTNDMKSGSLTTDELSDLIGGQSSLLNIAALTESGLAQIEADEFRQGVIDLIVKTISSAV